MKKSHVQAWLDSLTREELGELAEQVGIASEAAVAREVDSTIVKLVSDGVLVAVACNYCKSDDGVYLPDDGLDEAEKCAACNRGALYALVYGQEHRRAEVMALRSPYIIRD